MTVIRHPTKEERELLLQLSEMRVRVAELEAQAGRLRDWLVKIRDRCVEAGVGDNPDLAMVLSYASRALASSPPGEWEAMQRVERWVRKAGPFHSLELDAALAALDALRGGK
jgi:hypothetical protein